MRHEPSDHEWAAIKPLSCLESCPTPPSDPYFSARDRM
jgi:hypothetical protein